MQTLNTFSSKHDGQELTSIIEAISQAGLSIHHMINQIGLMDISGSLGIVNSHGEQQQKLDVLANEKYKEILADTAEVCGLASEEEESFVELNLKGDYLVLIDPLDGSSNIDTGSPVGTIFSVYKRLSKSGEEINLDDFLQAGHEQVLAGYLIYGSSTMLVYSTGKGVNGFTLDTDDHTFYLSHKNIQTPKKGNTYSINEGNTAFFTFFVKQYLEFCKSFDIKTGRPYSSRYVGSLVADFHRSLIQGGIFLYPDSSNYPNGKLRLLYECNAMAYLCEQAGGKSLSAYGQSVLTMEPNGLHQRTPLYVGSTEMVDQLESIMGSIDDQQYSKTAKFN